MRIDLHHQIVGQTHPFVRRDCHSSNLPAIGEAAESASLARWTHVVVPDGEGVESMPGVERRNHVAFLVG